MTNDPPSDCELVVSYELPMADPDTRLNLNARIHWAVRARATRNWRHAACTWWRHSFGNDLGLAPSTVQVSFGVRDPGRRRDAHNWAPTVKAIIDGLVDAGAWPDDHTGWVTVLDSTFHKGDGVIITVAPRSAP